jgi:hypothetical protein
MQPIVDRLAAQGYPVRKVDIDQDRALAARFGVTAVPCFVMLVDGQEVDRVVGGTTQARLEQMLGRTKSTRAGQASQSRQSPPTFASAPGPAVVRGQSPDAAGPAAAQNPMVQISAPSDVSLPGVDSGPLVTSDPTILQGPHRQSLAQAGAAMARNDEACQKCLASSVRLKVEDSAGNSVGSGTIVDAREGEALVLTCAHIFRESKGQGQIYLDLFGSGAPKRVPGQLIGYDLKRDVGLVSFRPGVPVVAARLAPTDYVVKRGDAVISVGCDNGREPSARQSHVTSTDKFLPPPNIQVAGQPVEGRSGGGLFTADCMVIGVCNAADPADNEGLYAGVGSIHGELARKGLTEMIIGPSAGAPTAAAPPLMASSMPRANQRATGPQVVPTSAAGPRGTLAGQLADTPLPAAQSAALDRARAQAGAAQVICIVRPLADPHAMGEIVVVDQASSEFLRQLTAEAKTRTTRRLPASDVDSATSSTRSREELMTADSWQPNLGARRFK